MDGYKLTLEEVRDIYSKTGERIKNIEEKAYNRLFPGYSELKNESEKLLKKQGIEPKDEEIAKSLGWPLERVISIKKDVKDFKNRIDSSATSLDFENMVNSMSPEFKKEFRDILQGMTEGKPVS